MTALPSMPLYVDDYEADTAHLTPEEDGVYNRLLRLCWRSPGCQVPDNAAWLARKLRVDQATWERACVPVIDEFFTRKNGVLFQKRQREEFLYVSGIVRARKEAGSKGGKAKYRKSKANDGSKANQLPEANEKQIWDFALAPTPTPTPTNKEEEDARARETISENQEGESQGRDEPSPQPTAPPNHPAVQSGFMADLRQAVGVQPNDAGAYWSDGALAAHVEAWRSHGLTDDQIIAEARNSRARNPDPPDGPKALDRWMETAAKAKRNAPKPGQEGAKQRAEVKPPPTPEERLAFYADWVNSDKAMPPSAINNTLAMALLDAGLVTRDRLKKRGIAA